ncbi:MAG: polymer-forming cytoskeletal protein [Nitrospirae bacterium]|nr:polymer-forming cytoskeletal protein [Nitrospirota bacterium]
MFSKNTEKLESIIGVNTQFKGNIKVKGTLRIDGFMEGNVEADWFVLGDKAYLKGNAEARGIIVGGNVEGNLTAKEIIEIKQKGKIKGDITTNKLTIAEGGRLQGRTTMQDETEQKAESISSSETLKESESYGS